MNIFLNKKHLKTECEPVTFEKPDLNHVLGLNMLAFMKRKKAIGLAANQIGKPIRLFVMNVNGPKMVFNPTILGVSEEYLSMPEGCLSFPKEEKVIDRPKTIEVEYYTSAGERVTEIMTGLEARCFMHEYDHLNGITMIERVADVANR